MGFFLRPGSPGPAEGARSAPRGPRLFFYRAVAPGRRRVQGYLQAASREAALEALGRRRWATLLLCESAPPRRPAPRWRSGRDLEEGMLVARQMALLCRAGVPLLAACEVLLRQAGGCRWGREMARVRRDLAGGASPSAALGRHPRLFPPWAEAVLRAAEASGTLPEALEGLARSYERSLRTRRQLVTAARYPALVLATALVANLVLLRWFAPAFERAFEQAGLALPGLTRWLLAGAEILGRSSTWVTVALAAMALFGWLGSQAGRQSLLHLLPRLPGLGRLWSMAEMAEVFSALSGMLAAGVRMQEALGRVVQVAFFPRTRASLLEVRRRVLGGTPLSQALSAEVFGPAAGHLLRASEEAGDHAGMLRRLAEGLSLDLEVALEAWTAALSPLLIALVGLAIALMVLALFLPLYSAMASFA